VAQNPYFGELNANANPALTLMARAYRDLETSSEALVAEKQGLAERLSLANETIGSAHQKDLALIAAVQSMLLPREARVRTHRAEVAAFYRAADDCGGDWWWYDEDETRLRVFVGDVSGHGAGSAMVTGSVSSACRMARELSPGLDAAATLELLHRELWSMARGEYHMTMLVLEIPRTGDTIQLYSAAAPHVLFMSPDGKVTVAVTRGTPLGMPTDRFVIGRAEVRVVPGTRIMCFTDGVYEFQTTRGQELGVKALRQFLAESRGVGGEEATKRIMHAVDALHPTDVPQEDDMTLVLVDVKS
jgi:sigma-B regulation protein RsbU (phosphoserine phosphatase)